MTTFLTGISRRITNISRFITPICLSCTPKGVNRLELSKRTTLSFCTSQVIQKPSIRHPQRNLVTGKQKVNMAMGNSTKLRYQHDGNLLHLDTTIESVQPLSSLDETNRNLFKGADETTDFVLTVKETIFHPQGGGQPSDEGTITVTSPEEEENDTPPTLEMEAARHAAHNDDLVLHLVRPTNPSTTLPSLQPGTPVRLSVNAEKRHLYSRLHTAGHVLGSAVRCSVGSRISDFDELKASHFPDSAACEFRGSVAGEWKGEIQAEVDSLVQQALPVEIEFWTREDFVREGMQHLLPEREGETFRVVRIRGAEVYPCGGTHVESTEMCGKVGVRKIARSKGNSRVSYTVS